MKNRFLQIIIFCFAIFPGVCATAAAPLIWSEKEKTFDADVSGVALPELLQKISAMTGWEIYQEPGITHSASAKFKKLPRSEALRKLFGDLNFEISPQSNSVPKLFVFRTGAEKATQRVRSSENGKVILGKDKAILNQLIVSLKPGSKININVLAAQLGGKVIGKLDGIESYLLEFPDAATASAAREQLSKVDGVASVDSNYSQERPAPFAMSPTDRSSPFNLKADANGGDGKEIIIGLIDTTVQKLGGDMQGFLLPGISVAGEANAGGDIPTHGTTMAESMLFGLNSTAAQGQTSVKILPVDVYGPNGETTTFHIANGIVQAVNAGANIVSISSGGAGDSEFLQRLTEEVYEKGIPIFAAAGNQPVTTPTYPAAYSHVVAVTSAQDQRGTIASYANRGGFVDVILPGATIVTYNGRNYYANGTSVSTALASGMMAGLAERSRRPPIQILPTFRSSMAFRRQ